MTYERIKNNRINIMLFLAVVLLAATAVSAQQFSIRPKASRFAPQGNNAAANSVFASARDLIDDAQWARAEQKFGQYISAYPNEKNLDAAMYWVAYSQYKLRKFQQSKETITHLLQKYQQSPWKEDAELLLAQLPGGVTVQVDPVTVTVEPVVVTPVALPGSAAPLTVVTPTASVAIAQQPATPAPPAPVAIDLQSPEMQQRIAEAQERQREAQDRVREAQERMQERMVDAQERLKEKLKFDFKYDIDLGMGIGSGAGMGVGVGMGKESDDDPCEIKIVALQALFEADPQRGMAIANDWLKPNSTQTVTCKRAALTLLARHGGKSVTPTILSIAQSETDLKIKTRAIALLGSSNDESVVGALRDFALNSTQNEVVEAALYGLSQHNSPQALSALADIALSNKAVNVRKAAIRAIAQRPGEPAVDALFRIYDSGQDVEMRKSVISGFGNRKSERAGAKLVEIATSSDNIEFRKEAIRGIARRGGAGVVDILMRLYDSEKNEEMKDSILNSFSYVNDTRVTQKLISIAENPQTPPERRRRVIGMLAGRGKDPAVIAFFEKLVRQ